VTGGSAGQRRRPFFDGDEVVLGNIRIPYTVKSFSDFMSTAFCKSLSKMAAPVAMTIEANVEHISKIATEDEEDRAKLNKAQVVAEFVIEPDQNATVVLQPGKEALDLPTTLVTTQLTPILRLWFFTITLVRRNQFNVTLIQETFIEWIRVIGFVRNQSLWRLIDQQRI
jgi:hypothetical protein